MLVAQFFSMRHTAKNKINRTGNLRKTLFFRGGCMEENKYVENDYDDALSLIGRAASNDDLLAGLAKSARQMGFDHVAMDYVPARLTGGKHLHISTYSEKWLNERLRLPMGVIVKDPVLQHLDTQVIPIAWGQANYEASKLENVYELFQGHGLGSGLAVAIRGAHGDCAYVGFSSDAQSVARTPVLGRELALLTIGAAAAYTALYKLVQARAKPTPRIQLTPREIEILQWSRAGKTALDCSQILGISQATVHFHVKNALLKLDVCSKQQAVLKALELRMIL
jgi:LuxR family transcriptional regulator, quorum-sensing system regulator SolR